MRFFWRRSRPWHSFWQVQVRCHFSQWCLHSTTELSLLAAMASVCWNQLRSSGSEYQYSTYPFWCSQSLTLPYVRIPRSVSTRLYSTKANREFLYKEPKQHPLFFQQSRLSSHAPITRFTCNSWCSSLHPVAPIWTHSTSYAQIVSINSARVSLRSPFQVLTTLLSRALKSFRQRRNNYRSFFRCVHLKAHFFSLIPILTKRHWSCHLKSFLKSDKLDRYIDFSQWALCQHKSLFYLKRIVHSSDCTANLS